jgi:tRNA(fMet)-specific endonuclease VapC
LNSVIVGEILCGFDRGGSREKNKKIFDNFMESKDVLVLPVDGETAIRYAYLFTYLQKAGTMVSPNDLWIAATAMQHGFRVMTLDRDFLKIPQILVDYFEQM